MKAVWGTLGHLYIPYFRDVLYSFGFWGGALWSRPPSIVFTSTDKKHLKALFRGGEALPAMRARIKCRHVAKKWV